MPILVSDEGQLYVRNSKTLVPVPNLTSARLLAGQAATPQKASDDVLNEFGVEQPAGIVDAPGIWKQLTEELTWRACLDQAPRARTDPPWPVSIGVGEHGASLPEGSAIYARTQRTEYLITDGHRFELPPANSAHGRVIRRGLDVPDAAQAWQPPEDLLSVLPLAPQLRLPAEAENMAIWEHQDSHYLFAESQLTDITEFQAKLLKDFGIPVKQVDAQKLAETPSTGEAEPAAPHRSVQQTGSTASSGIKVSGGNNDLFFLPETQPRWLTTVGVCVQAHVDIPPSESLEDLPKADAFRYAVTTFDPVADPASGNAVRLRDSDHATHFNGPGSAVAVATGHGIHVIGEHGLRHQVSSEAVQMLGISEVHSMPWGMLRLLPEGTPLSPEAAARTFTSE